VKLPTEAADALLHAEQAEARPAGGGGAVEADAVVADEQVQRFAVTRDRDADTRGACMSADVEQRLADDPVDRRLDLGRGPVVAERAVGLVGDRRLGEYLIGAVVERGAKVALVEDRWPQLRLRSAIISDLTCSRISLASTSASRSFRAIRNASRSRLNATTVSFWIGPSWRSAAIRIRSSSATWTVRASSRARSRCAASSWAFCTCICASRASRSSSACLRALMSSAKPWLYHGRPSPSRTIVWLSDSQTHLPSAARNRYSTSSGSPLSRDAR
jgi:hypothetical protein